MLEERALEIEEGATRHAERERQLGRRAAKLAVNETQLANKLRDVREAEERIPVLEERAFVSTSASARSIASLRTSTNGERG